MHYSSVIASAILVAASCAAPLADKVSSSQAKQIITTSSAIHKASVTASSSAIARVTASAIPVPPYGRPTEGGDFQVDTFPETGPSESIAEVPVVNADDFATEVSTYPVGEDFAKEAFSGNTTDFDGTPEEAFAIDAPEELGADTAFAVDAADGKVPTYPVDGAFDTATTFETTEGGDFKAVDAPAGASDPTAEEAPQSVSPPQAAEAIPAPQRAPAHKRN